jgi:hypothetical protein
MARLSAKLSSVRLKLYACMCAVHGSSQVLQGSVSPCPSQYREYGDVESVRGRRLTSLVMESSE